METREIYHLVLAIFVLGFVVALKPVTEGQSFDIIILLIIAAIIAMLTNVLAKKIAAHYYETKLEHKIWMWQRFGIRREQKFKKPMAGGVIIPFFISILTLGNFLWMAVLEFDVKTTTARVSKRHGIFKFTDLTDIHLGLIAASGLIANLIAAITSYLLGAPEIARISIFYAAFSLVPIGNLDGTKIFFSNKALWATLATITVIFLGYALFLP